MEKQKLIIIAGPTASSKSDIAFFLAQRLNGEIINADSIQIYRFFNIGSAKPPKIYREKIPHHLIDILDPNEEFNAFIFKKMAQTKIKEIYSKKKFPILVGGTGLYIRCLLYGLFEQDNEKIYEARKYWKEELDRKGLNNLYHELLIIDPECAKKIHFNDRVRILRALEYYTATGERLSNIQKRFSFQNSSYDFVILVPEYTKEELIRRIEERTKKIFNDGIIEETKNIIQLYGKDIKPLYSIGYKESLAFIEGKITLDEATIQTIKATKEYAKRQKIWFKKEKNVKFLQIYNNNFEIFFEEAKKLLHNI